SSRASPAAPRRPSSAPALAFSCRPRSEGRAGTRARNFSSCGAVHDPVEATLRRARVRAWATEPSPMSIVERLLIARLRQRDEQAFNEVVHLHGDKVFNLVLRMVGTRAEAEDIA